MIFINRINHLNYFYFNLFFRLINDTLSFQLISLLIYFLNYYPPNLKFKVL